MLFPAEVDSAQPKGINSYNGLTIAHAKISFQVSNGKRECCEAANLMAIKPNELLKLWSNAFHI